MTGWMLYCREDAEKNRTYVRWFQEEGVKLGITIKLKILEELDLAQEQALPDFVLNRSRNSNVAEQLEARGVRCVNSSVVSKVSNDKAEIYGYFKAFEIPMLPTWALAAEEGEIGKRAWEYPVVAKSVDGHGGSEVFWIERSEDWAPVISALAGRRIVVQKPCGMLGRDLRIFVLGGEAIAAVLRESDSDFRANYSLGGQIRLVELTQGQEELVKKICEIFPMEWGGIDLLFDSEENYYLNEVEDAVGSRSLSQLTDLNIAHLVLLYIQKSQELK